MCLNEVRPRRPEQFTYLHGKYMGKVVSMKSGLEGRNNLPLRTGHRRAVDVSMKSGLEGRNNHEINGTMWAIFTESQ